jgi:hypothetical protein
MTTAIKSLQGTGLTFLDFATCASAALTTYRESMSLRVAFPVNPIVTQESGVQVEMSVTCGLSSSDSFASLGPDMSWLKTYQGYYQATMDGSLEAFSGTWPRAGMMRNGSVCRQRPLVLRISGTAFSFWPTPTVPNGGRSPKGGITPTGQTLDGKKRQVDLQHAVRMVERQMWPTPTAMNNTGGAALCKWGGSGARKRLRQIVSDQELNGALNPMWVELLMGFPPGWTDTED